MNANPQDPPDPDGAAQEREPATPRADRKRLIEQLREARGSDVVLTYITSTRTGSTGRGSPARAC